MGDFLRYIRYLRSLHNVKNTFNFPRLTRSDYESIRVQCEFFCENIVQDIIATKKDNDFDLSSKKEYFDNYEIVSKYGDWLGPVVKKEEKYFRCIKKESVDKFKLLWSSGILKVFSKKGYLPQMSITNYYTDEFPIIIEQENLIITDVTKLSLEESKKGLLFVSLLQYISKRIGFALIDPHYFNYTFYNNRFVYFDLGSFSTVDDYSKYRDFSMVVLGAYRILFSYFPDSVLSKQDLGEFRHNTPVSYRTDYFEFNFYKEATYRYCKIHCTKYIYKAFRDIFSNNECTPWNVIICFFPERKDDVGILLKEIM